MDLENRLEISNIEKQETNVINPLIPDPCSLPLIGRMLNGLCKSFKNRSGGV